MCGIFGAIDKDSVTRTLQALHFLEYRGYDSAGIAYKNDKITVVKTQGRVSVLEEKLPIDAVASVAIGHTRWATHGRVCNENAHPFLSQDGHFAICHNGIIENCKQLRSMLTNSGFEFTSETDSETVAHLLQYNFKGDVLQSVISTAQMLSGSFAVLAETEYDDNLYAIKNKSPLIVGVNGGEIYLCSDVRCVANLAEKVAIVADNTVVRASGQGVEFFGFDGKRRAVEWFAPTKTQTEQTVVTDYML